MDRRNFIQAFTAFAGLLGFAPSCKKKKVIKGAIVGASAPIGHLLRDKTFAEPVDIISKDVVIIGGGVSGLSAARTLQNGGISNFTVLDLEQHVGGNAACGTNAVSAYPWGAHYIPLPNNTLTDYIEFLTEAGVITGMNETGLPIYNEYYLCFDPQERLYINGRWQEGLVPHFGVPDNEKEQIERFLSRMDAYRQAVGTDGKEAFALPANNSSKDVAFVQLDEMTMQQWLQQQNFTSPYLQRYVNYCTRDDFGTPLHLVSAWAGIHYFACRKGKGANAEHSDALTWPEGNGWLVAQLQKGIKNKIQTGALAVAVKPTADGVVVHYFDVATRQLKGIKAKQCVLAIPQFVASRLLNDRERSEKVAAHLHYVPWMVANLTVSTLEERSGAPLSWDNVLYESQSLGYVEATHESLQGYLPKRNLTYYLPLTGGTPAEERKAAQSKTHTQWVEQIVADLKVIHPNIEDALEEVNVMIWGHAMAQALPGLVHGPARGALSASIANRIHFAHTDVAGVSLFEEAFYQGLNAAKNVTHNLKEL